MSLALWVFFAAVAFFAAVFYACVYREETWMRFLPSRRANRASAAERPQGGK